MIIKYTCTSLGGDNYTSTHCIVAVCTAMLTIAIEFFKSWGTRDILNIAMYLSNQNSNATGDRLSVVITTFSTAINTR